MSENLRRLVTSIEDRLVAIDAAHPQAKVLQDHEAWRTRQRAYAVLVNELVAREQAKHKPGDADVLTLAGIRTSCTGGSHGLLVGWVRRARAEIAKAKGDAA